MPIRFTVKSHVINNAHGVTNKTMCMVLLGKILGMHTRLQDWTLEYLRFRWELDASFIVRLGGSRRWLGGTVWGWWPLNLRFPLPDQRWKWLISNRLLSYPKERGPEVVPSVLARPWYVPSSSRLANFRQNLCQLLHAPQTTYMGGIHLVLMPLHSFRRFLSRKIIEISFSLLKQVTTPVTVKNHQYKQKKCRNNFLHGPHDRCWKTVTRRYNSN